MKTIRISNRVYEEIAKRGKFGETPNDVLELVFKIEKEPACRRIKKSGFLPPDGTECRFNHNGKYIYGKIKNGELNIPDVGVYSSLSTPASEITNKSLNGWLYWEIKLPGMNDNWILANNWRRAYKSQSTKGTSKENTKRFWFDATLNAVRRYCKRHHTLIFTLQGLIKEELDNIIQDTKTRGQTPINTLQYYLQRLRDEDYIEFLDNQGTYRLKQQSNTIS